MNTQMIVKAGPKAEGRSSEVGKVEGGRAARGPDKAGGAGDAKEIAEKGQANAAFGGLLSQVIRADVRTEGHGAPQGSRDGTAALARKSQAVGRTLRGLSDLAVGRGAKEADGSAVGAVSTELAGRAAGVTAEGEALASGGRSGAEAHMGVGSQARASGRDKTTRTALREAVDRTAAATVERSGPRASAVGTSRRGGPGDAGPAPDGAAAGPEAAPKDAGAAPKGGHPAARASEGPHRVAFEGGVGQRAAGTAGERAGAEAAAIQDAVLRPAVPIAAAAAAVAAEAPVRAARVAERIAWMVSSGTSRAEMELHPPDLGRLSLSVEVRGDHVAVRMVVESQEAHQRLRSDAEALARALADQGLALGGMEVSVGRGDREDRGDQDAPAGFAGPAPAARGAEGGPDAALAQTVRRVHDGAVDAIG